MARSPIHSRRPPARQQGFSLVTAIFILTVLATLSAFMITVGGVQHQTTLFAALGARAYHAAVSGMEWGAYQALNNPAPTCGNAPSTPLTTSFGLTGGGLDAFRVAVTCQYTRHQEGSGCFNMYAITARAENGVYGDDSYVSRRLQATVTDAPGGTCP